MERTMAALKEFLRAISALSASVAHPATNIDVATRIALLTFENMASSLLTKLTGKKTVRDPKSSQGFLIAL